MIIVQLRNMVRRRAADANSIPVNSSDTKPISGCSLRNHGMRPRNSGIPRNLRRSKRSSNSIRVVSAQPMVRWSCSMYPFAKQQSLKLSPLPQGHRASRAGSFNLAMGMRVLSHFTPLNRNGSRSPFSSREPRYSAVLKCRESSGTMITHRLSIGLLTSANAWTSLMLRTIPRISCPR